MEGKRLTGLRKRQQISKANKTMFLWVAVASVVVSFALVAAQYLFKQAAFNQKIISAKSEASKTLDKNINNAGTLKEEVNKLIANQALNAAKPQPAGPTDTNLRVVLDALPTENDPSALAASFQHAILNRSGVSIERLTTSAVDGVDEGEAAIVANEPVEMWFSMVINGNYEQIKAAMTDMERVIRPIKLNQVTIQGSDNQLRATIDGVTYYLPSKTVNVTTKTIKP